MSTFPAEMVRFGSICATGGDKKEEEEGRKDERLLRRMDLGMLDCSSACSRLSPKANIRTLDGSDTTRWRVLASQPICIQRTRVQRMQGTRQTDGQTFSLPCTYSTMYSYASLAALTRVSVPWTGSANESMTTIEFPITFPCIMPMISWGTPERAWMTWVDLSQKGRYIN
jgi:hypothetical protein